jgi:hypothetical protein
MVSAIKYRFRDGELEAELSISLEGVPVMEIIKELKLSVLEDIREHRLFKNQFENDEPVNEEHEVEDESSKLTPSNLQVKPATSELEQKFENKIKSDIMVA